MSAVPTSDPNFDMRANEPTETRQNLHRSQDLYQTQDLHQTLTQRVAHQTAQPPALDPDVRAFTIETVRELGYDVLESRYALHASSVPPLRNVLDGQDSSRHVN